MLSEGKIKINVRLLIEGDVSACENIWRKGFHEMHKSAYRKILVSPGLLVFAGFWAYLGYVSMRQGNRLFGFTLSFLGSMFYIPVLGPAIFSHLFWFAIRWQKFGGKQAGGMKYWVAELEGDSGKKIVGCVCVKEVHTLKKESNKRYPQPLGEASAWRLSVAPEARKLGVGRLLMTQAEAYAKERGFKYMSLITGNEESRKFYQRLGYSCEDEGRARRVLFGTGLAPTSLFGYLQEALLKGRLESTIMSRKL